MDDYEIFIGHYNTNSLYSLDDGIFFFNITNFDEEDLLDLKNKNFKSLVDKGKCMKFDSVMFHRMFNGQVSKGTCDACGNRLGYEAGGKGFGALL